MLRPYPRFRPVRSWPSVSDGRSTPSGRATRVRATSARQSATCRSIASATFSSTPSTVTRFIPSRYAGVTG